MATVRAVFLLVLVMLAINISYQIENFEQTEEEEVPQFDECLDRGVFSVPCEEITTYYQKNVNLGSMCSNPYIKAFCCVTCK